MKVDSSDLILKSCEIFFCRRFMQYSVARWILEVFNMKIDLHHRISPTLFLDLFYLCLHKHELQFNLILTPTYFLPTYSSAIFTVLLLDCIELKFHVKNKPERPATSPGN